MKVYKIMSNASPIAFLFPGQGSQSVGMGKELFDNHAVARRTFEEADEALGYKLSQLVPTSLMPAQAKPLRP